ncbi:MAG: hypothetical protein P1V36_06630 [Planctomycetota bacterium]|nr:hypothetical protein [Planctomycetota bacterium]
MSNQAKRDELAELCGYDLSGEPYRTGLLDHPFPDGDLTALAAVWPEELYLIVSNEPGVGPPGNPWYAYGENTKTGDEYKHNAPTEYDARLDLTIAVMEAKESEAEDD